MATVIFEADHPLVLDGTYDREGYKPGERARIAKGRARQALEDARESDRRAQAERRAPMGKTWKGKKSKRKASR